MVLGDLTHIDGSGQAHMVDVSGKQDTQRQAVATARVIMQSSTLEMILQGDHHKGDVFAVARIAGIQAAKRCSDLIPLCHPLPLTSVEVNLEANLPGSCVFITAQCGVSGKTGVEMEALTAASVAALTLYDMCKAVDRGMVIEHVCVEEKKGGKSGDWSRGAVDEN